MKLYMPTKVYSETDCVKNHAKEIAALGTKALLVTGRHSAQQNGSLQDVIEALQQEQISYVIYDKIEENPSVETVLDARKFGLANGVDFVIGIGGGSPLDASKAIALMMKNPEWNEEVLYQPISLLHLPVVCVPTTCGTGSEATQYSILTLHKQRTKKSISHQIFPALALLDAKYLKTMSRSGLVNTCVDALAHLVESYLNANSNDLNRIYSIQGLCAWAKFKDDLKNNTVTEKDYECMLHASMIAGMAIAQTGTSLPHGMSYTLTYEMGVAHGKAVGMFLGGYVELYRDKAAANQVLQLLGFADASAFRTYLKELLGEVEVSRELLEQDAEALLQNPAKLKNYPFAVTKEELVGLYL